MKIFKNSRVQHLLNTPPPPAFSLLYLRATKSAPGCVMLLKIDAREKHDFNGGILDRTAFVFYSKGSTKCVEWDSNYNRQSNMFYVVGFRLSCFTFKLFTA